MSRYAVEFQRAAFRQLEAVRDRRLHGQLEKAIERLADDPRPPGVTKMAGREGQWRVRVLDWRIVYRIEDDRLVVVVGALGCVGAAGALGWAFFTLCCGVVFIAGAKLLDSTAKRSEEAAKVPVPVRTGVRRRRPLSRSRPIGHRLADGSRLRSSRRTD